MLKYGKYLKCLFYSFLSQLFSNSVLFCSPFLNSDYSFSNFSGNFLFAGERGILSNHRSCCASICIPLIGPHKINFLSVVIYSFHLREWAPLELEGSFCHKNSPSNYIIRQLDTGSVKKHRDRAEIITFRLDKIRRLPPMCVKYCNLFFVTVFKIGSYVFYLVPFSAIEYIFKRSL